MTRSINKQNINTFRDDFNKSDIYRLTRNALTRSELKKVAMDWDRFSSINHNFSNTISNELPATNQNTTGRCWIFAALNLLRIKVARKFKLEKFELSQSYIYFWDKFEKANFFLENIMETANEPLESRIVSYLNNDPLQDGGQWHMFTNLIEKYGIVPKDIYPEQEACFNSNEMKYILTYKLREDGIVLREMIANCINKDQLQKEKEKMMNEIFRMLSIHMGTPPTSFNWEFQDKDKKFHSYRDLTPQSFLKQHVKCNVEDYICLVHSPREVITPFNKTYTIQYLGNVIEGREIKYVNVEIEELKNAAKKSIQHDDPVWFGCDVGKKFHRDLGIMDFNLYDYNLVYDTKFKMTKEMRMRSGESMMTHAMLFTGVNIVDDKPVKWKVENSWGEEKGNKGYFIMTDNWFDEYMFEVAIEKKYLPKSILEIEQQKPITLPPWDPLGSLA